MMLLSPSTVIWSLLAGGIIIAVSSRSRLRFNHSVAILATGLAFLGWISLRARLPATITFSEWPAVTQLSPWVWRVDELSWHLSGVLLVLASGTLLASLRPRDTGMEAGDLAVNARIPLPAQVLLLTAAGLIALWADTLAGLLAGWTLSIFVWGALLLIINDDLGLDAKVSFPKLIWLLLSLFFLWMAAANIPPGAGRNLNMASWPRIAKSSVLTAALLQMGVWPFLGWRPLDRTYPSDMSSLLHIIPALIGASVLARLVASSDFSMGYSLFLTAFSLLGMLLGIQRIWVTGDPARMPALLALVQTSTALLAGVWSGSEALLAEIRVMVLTVGILFIVPDPRRIGPRWWVTVSYGIALAAIMGLPLTAGFNGRVSLYNALLQDGRYILMLVTSLMYVPLVVAIARRVLVQNTTNIPDLEPSSVNTAWYDNVVIAAPLLLSLGLLSLKGPPLSTILAGSWLGLAIPFVGGLIAHRYLGDIHDTRAALRRAFALNLPLETIGVLSRAFLNHFGKAVRDAAVILEGEGGMIWMFVLIVVLLLIR
jgi:hypothetical protein